MSWRSWLAGATLAVSFALPAQAALIDFEDVTPNIFGPGEGFISRGYGFTFDAFGIGVVDSAATFLFGNAPPNANGQFVAALNTAGIVMRSATDDPFLISAFDYSFIAPLPGIGVPGGVVGELHLIGLNAVGAIVTASFLLPAADANGDFPFGTIFANQLGALGLGGPLASLGFFSCVYVGATCAFDDNLAQFALDNIRTVPAPSTLALALLAIGLVGAVRRRNVR